MTNKPGQPITGKVDLGQLIGRLGPLNNRWRESPPAEKVLTLWDMGEVIINQVPSPSDPLLWDIQKRSYLTRSLLRYALIVRRGWKQRQELKDLVSGLQSYTVFREALPFLKGGREGIDADTYGKVVSLLGDRNTSRAIVFLKDLKTRAIGRRHHKGTSVAAISDRASEFEKALAELELENVRGAEVLDPASSVALVALSQIAMALATEEPPKEIPRSALSLQGRLTAIADPLVSAIRGGRDSISAFRKVVGAERLMQAADLLNSMRGEASLAEWRRRRRSELLERSVSTTSLGGSR